MNDWRAAVPTGTSDFEADRESYSQFWKLTAELLARLPAKPRRNAQESQAAEELKNAARQARKRFAQAHAPALYDRLTENGWKFVRVQQLAYDAAALVPGLAPTREEVAAESALPQRDKDGHEIDQGILLWALLAQPETGRHLCHAMLLPRPEARACPSWRRRGGSIWLRRKYGAKAGRPS